MKVLLLAGYSQTEDPENSFALKELQGIKIIDWQIGRLKAICGEVVVVLGGTDSEELLRQSRLVREAELVFDTHGPEASPWTNLKAGLQHGPGWTFALDILHPAPVGDLFQRLHSEYLKAGLNMGSHIFCSTAHRSPWLITRKGQRDIKSISDFKGLSDERLNLVQLAEDSPPSAISLA